MNQVICGIKLTQEDMTFCNNLFHFLKLQNNTSFPAPPFLPPSPPTVPSLLSFKSLASSH